MKSFLAAVAAVFCLGSCSALHNPVEETTEATGATTLSGSSCRSDRLSTVGAVASSVEQPAFAASYVADGSTGTRWSSQFSDPQWIYVDLGAERRIDRVVLRWEAAASASYELRVSSDATSWRTVFRDTNGDGGVDTISGLATTGRYVMMHSLARRTQYGVSLFELEVYGDTSPSCGSCSDRALALDLSGSSGGWTNLESANDGVSGPGAPGASKATSGTEYLEYWLGAETPIKKARLWDPNASGGGVAKWNVLVWNGSAFVPAFALTDAPSTGWNEVSFPEIVTSRLRVQVQHATRVEVRELEVFGCAPAGGCSSEKLPRIAATASSVEHSGKTAPMAIDGDVNSRWSSQFSDPQWLSVDLGARRRIDRVVLRWENAASASYELQVSNDAQTWTTIYVDTAGNGGTDDISGLHATGRYVKMLSNGRTTSYGVSLFELEVYGSSNLECGGCFETPAPVTLAGSSGGWADAAGATDGVVGATALAATKASSGLEYLEYTLDGKVELRRARLWEDNNGTANVEDWNVQAWNGTAFVDLFPLTDTPVSGWNDVSFTPTLTDRVRVRVRDTQKVEVRELQLFGCKPAGGCSQREFAQPASGCAGTGLQVVGHDGFSRAIFQGRERFETGKQAEPVEELDFTFNQAISLERAPRAVQIISTSCPAAVLPASCTHEVKLDFSLVGADGKTLRAKNQNDPFLPGCRYELRINTGPLTGSNQCLGGTVKLPFQSRAKNDGGALEREMDDVAFAPDGGLASFKPKKTVFWQTDDLFRRRVAALGLRPGVDAFAPGRAARVSGYARGAESIEYRQSIGGYPVLDGGFVAQRDAVSGRVLHVAGRAIPNLAVPAAPSLTAEQARAVAAAQVPGQTVSGPAPELGIVPVFVAGSAPSYKLAYRFMLSAADRRTNRAVDVDARTGAVLASVDLNRRACNSVDVTTLAAPTPPWTATPIALNTLQSAFGENQPTSLGVTAYKDAAGAPVYAADRRGGAPIEGSEGRPAMYAQCEGKVYPEVVRFPKNKSDITWAASEEDTAAQLLLAAQSCVDYFATRPRGFRGGGAQWSGIDGTGTKPVSIAFDSTLGPSEAQFNYALSRLEFSPHFAHGAAIDAICHEYAHGVMANLNAVFLYPEALSIGEGVADIFGGAAELAKGGVENDLWCTVKDYSPAQPNVPHSCMRYMDSPAASTPSQPRTYRGLGWCDGPCTGREHENAGVVTQWFFLITKGIGAGDPSTCGKAIPSLGANLSASVDLATEIVFRALRDHAPSAANFRDFANATIEAAEKVGGELGRSDELKLIVTSAWHAVNVWDRPFDAADWSPHHGALSAHPWEFLTWREDATADFGEYQIDTSPNFNGKNGAPLFEGSVATQDYDRLPNGAPAPAGTVVRLASTAHGTRPGLEANKQYYWRTRPGFFGAPQARPWGCEAIHFFTTSPPPELDEVSKPDEDEVLAPNGAVIEWKGAGHRFKVQVALTDTSCGAGAAQEQMVERPHQQEEQDPFRPFRPQMTATFSGLLPDTEYWVEILPIGPAGADGVPVEGACFKRKFATGLAEAPTKLGVTPESSLEYFGPGPVLTWSSPQGTAKHKVEFYSINSQGACSDVPAHKKVVTKACNQGGPCTATLDTAGLFPKRNLGGYCWDVTPVAPNDVEGEKARGSFKYYIKRLEQTSPGTLGEDAVTIPGNSFGKPVHLEWKPVPGALDYVVRVGTRQWVPSERHVPENQGNNDVAAQGLSPAAFQTKEPQSETVREVVTTGTSLELSADQVGEGTYCWTVWPEMEKAGGQEAANMKRRPLVETDPPFCFSVGPTKPVIVIDEPAAGTARTGESISGHIELSYSMDFPAVSSTDLDGAPAFALDYSGCQRDRPSRFDQLVEALPFRDCMITFHGVAREEDAGEAYEIRVKVGPHDEKKSITVVPCGGLGEDCCRKGSACDAATSTCSPLNNTCIVCGGLGQSCCVTANSVDCKRADKLVCASDLRCAHCGRPGEPCCLDAVECESGNKCLDSFICGGGQGPCASLGAVNITGPGTAQADFNALLGCTENGKALVGHGRIIQWNAVPGATNYFITDAFNANNRWATTGTTYPLTQPSTNACGISGVYVQAVSGTCAGPIALTSGLYFIWE